VAPRRLRFAANGRSPPGLFSKDVQLGKLRSDWKYRTYASKALNPDNLEPHRIKYLQIMGR
jgi:hypothetical protein